ncbi:hypothetical protein, partial [Cronobacter malonaticus]|uniref:hypothetical protein n=1 Tax=Cronobacter malonaticus TaxID=413503 RepID=UPI0024C31995
CAAAPHPFFFFSPPPDCPAGDIHHIYLVFYIHSRLLCETDHCRHSSFHFEVENNSLQTFNTRR